MGPQGLVAGQLFALGAGDFAAARHVGDDEFALVRQGAGVVTYPARRTADHIDVDHRLAGQGADQARLAGADLAEEGDVAIAALAPSVEFDQFLFEALGLGLALAQFGDPGRDRLAVRWLRPVAAAPLARCRPQQLPGQHGQAEQRGSGDQDQWHAQQQGQIGHALVELEQAVDQADGQADHDQRGNRQHGQQEVAHGQAGLRHPADSSLHSHIRTHARCYSLCRPVRCGAVDVPAALPRPRAGRAGCPHGTIGWIWRRNAE